MTFNRYIAIVVLAVASTACRRQAPTPSESASTGSKAATIESSAPRTDACPESREGKKQFQIENEDLEEASDIAVSTKNTGVFWSHNDSGGRARLFAFDSEGRDLGTYHLENADLEDWEDMAMGPGPNPKQPYLYVGDIGANNRAREQISVYRIEEPEVKLDQKPKKRKIGQVTRFRFVFPDEKSHDCEALMVDPRSGDLYLVTKPRRGAPVVYRQKAPLDDQHVMKLEEVLTIDSISAGPSSPTLVTSADLSPDGSMILIRTYERAYLWLRRSGDTVEAAMSRPPCNVALRSETQGESIAFTPDSKGYYTVSEGKHPKVYSYELGSSK